MFTRMKALLAVAALAVSAGAASAATVSIADANETTVRVTAPLDVLGLEGAPFGTATVDFLGSNPVFSFPITGGTVDTDTGAAVIEHEGSGVTLTAGTTSATVGNFVIDTAAGSIFGDLIGAATGLELFTLGAPNSSGLIPIFISDTLGGAIDSFFGVSDLAGAQFGLASTDPSVVPVPASGLLLIAGLGGIAAMRRRARA